MNSDDLKNESVSEADGNSGIPEMEAEGVHADTPPGFNPSKIMLRIVAFVLIIGLGVAVMYGLKSMKQPPRQIDISEPTLQVEVNTVYPEDVPVIIPGYGTVRSIEVIQVTPEVMGQVVAVNQQLEQGEVIPEGDLLFRIDQRDYRSTVEQAQAQVARAEASVAMLKQQYVIDKERLETVQRTSELAGQEFDRVQELYSKDDVGTQSGVDQAEIALNQTEDLLDQLTQLVELSPLRIKEAENALTAARAQLDLAKTRLERTEVYAPFNARIKMPVQLEVGQYVAPGVPVLVLANDSVLEISVPLDSRDARSWLQFEEPVPEGNDSWFGNVKPVECRISWTEDTEEHYWTGMLNRVEQFDQTTRTVTVAVRISGNSARDQKSGLPLVDGMFCKVEIPGRMMEQVYRLPRWAVSFEGQVYLAEADRLERRDVEVVRSQGEETFVSSGLEPGDLVITTRLVNPLPGSLLEYVSETEKTAEDSGNIPTNAEAAESMS